MTTITFTSSPDTITFSTGESYTVSTLTTGLSGGFLTMDDTVTSTQYNVSSIAHPNGGNFSSGNLLLTYVDWLAEGGSLYFDENTFNIVGAEEASSYALHTEGTYSTSTLTVGQDASGLGNPTTLYITSDGTTVARGIRPEAIQLNGVPVGKDNQQTITVLQRYFNLVSNGELLPGLGTVDVNALLTNDVLQYNGKDWVNASVTESFAAFDYIFVKVKTDFPTAVAGVITLADNTTYFITTTVDLEGDRLVSGSNTVLLGPSSENARLKSTGLGVGVALLTSEWTIPIRHVTFQDVDTCLDLDGSVNPPMALDWTGVNFQNIPNVGTIDTCNNFIFSKGAFLTAQGLNFTGSVGTLGIDNSLFVGDGSADPIISLDASAVVTRRFRTIYSSFVAFGSTEAVTVNASATIPVEGFILDTCNFSGGGTYLGGLDETSNTTRFTNCKGITNTAVNGQMYWKDNATATTVSVADTFYKVSGTSTASPDNAKFTMTDNRLTCDATVPRKFLIQCNLSFNAGANNECEFGFYDSTFNAGAGGVRTPSITKSTASTGGRAENVSFMCVTTLETGDYIEVHCANTSATTNITATDLNVVVTEIQ